MSFSRFIELAELHASTDYASKRSVASANTAAEELGEIGLAALNSPDDVEAFLALLNNPVARSWVAYIALQNGSLSEFQRARCMSVIEAIAKGKDMASVGARAWLKQHVGPG